MRPTRLLVALPALALLACDMGERSTDAAVTSTDVATVRAEIERVNQRISDLVARGAFDSVPALYTSDAMVLPPNAPPMAGDSVGAFWRAAPAQGIKSLELESTDVEVSGDLAVETGNYTLGVQGPDGASMTDRGKYLVVWKRQPDGTWKLHRDMFNTSMPATQGG